MNLLTNNIIFRGGWVMVPIILGSIVALGLSIERGVFLWKIRLDVKRFADQVFSLLKDGLRASAVDLCNKTRHPIGRIFSVALQSRGKKIDEIERLMEHTGNDEVSRLEKNMNLLMVIVGVEPMLGFLGTILGLIRAFMQWETAGASVTVEVLAAGIYQAMITTAGGLIVAIPYYIIYNIYTNRINATAREMNHYGEELLDLMKQIPAGSAK